MRRFVAIICLLTISLVAFSQSSVKSINDDIRKSQEIINEINQHLKDNKKQQNDKDLQRKLLDSKVLARQKIIEMIDINIANLKRDMGGLAGVVSQHSRRLDSLTMLKGKLYRQAYKRLVNSNLSGGLSSVVNPMKSEIVVVEKLILKEMLNSDSIKRIVGNKYDVLMEQSAQLNESYVAKKAELRLLAFEKNEVEQLNKLLKKEELTLVQNADNERVKIQNLQKQIAAFVHKESNSAVILSGKNFADNKGKLPPPLSFYTIEDVFGVHNHPTKKSIKIQNTGINIRATNDLEVSVIFEGEVRGIFLVEGMGQSVLVRHGNYFSVYSNLSQVGVSKGQVLKTGQAIGRLSDSNKVLHFEIWSGTTNLNPQIWIRKR